MLLSLPDTANITLTRKCQVAATDYENYTDRSSLAPLSEIEIDLPDMTLESYQLLISEIESAKGATPVQLPYVGGNRQFIIAEYQVYPQLYGEVYQVQFTAIEQRTELVPYYIGVPRLTYPAWQESQATIVYPVRRSQYDGGFQSIYVQGEARKRITAWNVEFQLSVAETDNFDTLMSQLRGVYPFYWHPTGDLDNLAMWICDEWRIEYHSPNLCLLKAKFVGYSDREDYQVRLGTLLDPISLSTTPDQPLIQSVWQTSTINPGGTNEIETFWQSTAIRTIAW